MDTNVAVRVERAAKTFGAKLHDPPLRPNAARAARREVHALVGEARDERGATVLLATHDLGEAEALCDRLAVIYDGRVAAVDTPAGLKARAGGTLEEAFLALTSSETDGEKL